MGKSNLFGKIHVTSSKKQGGARILSVLLTLALVLSLLPAVGLAVGEADWTYWTDVDTTALTAAYDTGWYGSAPQPGATYSIDTAARFAGLAAIVNSTTAKPAYYTKYDPQTSTNRFLTETGAWAQTLAEAKTLAYDNFNGCTVNLTADINLAGSAWYPIGGVSPLDESGVPTGQYFAGTFNGYKASATPDITTYNTHSISNIHVSYITTTPPNDSGYGVFGYVNGGKLLNLSLTGAVNVGDNDVSAIGGLVGYTNGDIYNIHSDMTVSMTNQDSSMLGGIAGTVENKDQTKTVYVQYCSNTGAVTGRGRVGGIVGAVYCAAAGGVIVDNCYNRANAIHTVGTAIKSYLGGIVGYCQGFVTNCYVTATQLTTAGGHYQGGIAGLLQGDGPQASMSNSYAAVTFAPPATPEYDRPLVATVDRSDSLHIIDCLYDLTAAGDFINEPGTGANEWGWWTTSGTAPTTTFTNYPNYGPATVYTSTGSSADPSTAPVLNVLGDAYLADNASGTVINVGYPILAWQANGVPPYTPVVSQGIYLNGVSGDDNNDGKTPSAAVKTFTNAKGKLTTQYHDILINGTVTINNGTEPEWSLGVGQTVRRGEDTNGVVFAGALVNVINSPAITGILTLGNITIDGSITGGFASDSLVTVHGGTLNIKDSAILRNNTRTIGDGGAIYLDGNGTLTIAGGRIYGNTANHGAGVFFGSGTFNIAPTAPITLTGEIYLSGGMNNCITVKGSLADNLTDALELYVPNPQNNLVVAKGDGYTLTADDTRLLSYEGGGWFVALNTTGNTAELQLEGGVFLDGVAGNDSNPGTSRTMPVKTLGRALAVQSQAGGNIYSLDTVTVAGIVDDSTAAEDGVILMRSTTSVEPIFDVVAPSGALSLSKITLDGNVGETYWNKESLIEVHGGSVALSGEAKLINSYAAEGGAINIVSGTVTMSGGTISDNRSLRGGAVFVNGGGTFNLSGGTISGNKATNTGGAVRVGGQQGLPATFTMTGGEIHNNAAGTEGGSTGSGGGVSILEHGVGNMSAGFIRNNTAQSNGGGVSVSPGGSFEMTGSSTIGGAIGNNTAKKYGGGVYVSGQEGNKDTTFTMSNGSINSNNAQVGGGIYVTNPSANYTATGGTVSENKAIGIGYSSNGGGAYIVNTGDVNNLTNISFTQNTAEGSGGGIYADNSDITLGSNTKVENNNARAYGGGIYATGSDLTFNGAHVTGNHATAPEGNNAYGGGIYVNSGELFLNSGCVINGNRADATLDGISYGGGIYLGVDSTGYMDGAIIGGDADDDGNAASYGGGVYISNHGTLDFKNGTIKNNDAILSGKSNGIYVVASEKLTLAPSGAGAITFGPDDDIYLPNGVTFKITEALDPGSATDVHLTFENPQIDVTVATAASAGIASSSYGKLKSGTIVFDVDGTEIYISRLQTIAE